MPLWSKRERLIDFIWWPVIFGHNFIRAIQAHVCRKTCAPERPSVSSRFKRYSHPQSYFCACWNRLLGWCLRKRRADVQAAQSPTCQGAGRGARCPPATAATGGSSPASGAARALSAVLKGRQRRGRAGRCPRCWRAAGAGGGPHRTAGCACVAGGADSFPRAFPRERGSLSRLASSGGHQHSSLPRWKGTRPWVQ